MPVPQVQGLRSPIVPPRVFVYGTLKKGFSNHEYHLKDCKELGEATIEGLMFHLGGFPAINLSERFTRIFGEVYEVGWENITSMDRLEGVNHNFYDRIQARVEPHGMVWTYIFPHDKAAKQDFIIPSGVWRGSDTPKMKWAGFGKGVEIGAFETRLMQDEIRIGPGQSDYVLRRSEVDHSYKLINKKTREVLGSYKHLRDMVGRDGVTKPVLSLPAVSRRTPGDTAVDTAVRDAFATGAHLPPHQQHPNMPIIWTPPGVGTTPTVKFEEPPKEEPIPQAARLLGLKYGEA